MAHDSIAWVDQITCAFDLVNVNNYPMHTYPVNRPFRYLRFYVISYYVSHPALQYFGLD